MTKRRDHSTPPLPRLPRRRADSHKGDYGRGLLIGGSKGLAGSIGLAGRAALRSGAGLLKLAVPEVCQDLVAGFEPSYMTVGLPSDSHGRIDASAQHVLAPLADEATAIGIGPGLGRSTGLDALVWHFYENWPGPLVVDADGLNALATRRDRLGSKQGPRILTPHPGEFARLVERTLPSGDDRRAMAFELAVRCEVVVVLKGHETLITDGRGTSTNATGNPGMATGGAGDVLTGVILGLLCQGLPPAEAARLGVHLHGLAGDLAAAQLGQVSLIASDLVQFLPQAFVQFEETRQ